jgi:two-component system, response regulator RegA
MTAHRFIKMQNAAQSDNCKAAQRAVEDTLLIVDDDTQLLHCLARAMETRGFEVTVATSVADSLAQIEANPPKCAVVDMRLADGCGLDVVAALKSRRPDARIVIQTGYGNIATAVRAIKIGAIDYMPKPADADEITAALLAPVGGQAKPPEHPMSASRVRWEHIQNVYQSCGRNVSETSRRLRMHRRTLQRILAKEPQHGPKAMLKN